MIYRKGFFSLLALCISVFLVSCRKSSTANWDVDAVVPVVNSKLNVRNFIADTLFESDANNLLHLRINQQLAALSLDSLVSIPDTVINLNFKNPLPFDNVLQPGAPINVPSSDVTFDFPDGVAISTVSVRSGKLKISFSNDLDQPLDIVYTFPTVKKGTEALKISETIPPGVNSLVKSYDLKDYVFGLRGATNTQYNTLAQTCSLSLSSSATSTALIKYNMGAGAVVGFEKIVPQFIEGYFGQQVVDLSNDTTDFSFLNNITASNFLLDEAKMTFTIVNEFGVDFSASISNVKAINSRTKKTVTLSGSQLSSINLDRATRVGSTLTTKSKVLNFTNANSNIAAFISTLPDKISYGGQIKMNPVPPGNISGYHDFAFYNTGLRILADIDIPLKFKADYFELQTISDFEFSGNSALEGYNDGAFVIYATNGFPFSAKVQAYLYDANNALIDSVFVPGQNIISAATLDAQNIVTSPLKSTVRVPIHKSTLDNLQRCKKIKVLSRLLLPPSPPSVSILSTYELGINITAEVNYNVDLGR